MVHSGKGFGLDLYQLEQVARADLPTVSGVYDDAISKCQKAERALGGMPAVPEQFVTGNSTVVDSYGRLHGVAINVLKSTRTSLDETAHALDEAAKLYAEGDRAAAAEFRRLLKERGIPKAEGDGRS